MRNSLYVLTLGLIGLFSELISFMPTVFAENVDRFWSILEGDQQIPPNNTGARGFVGLKFADDFSRLVYNVNVDNIKNNENIIICVNTSII